MPFQKKLEFGNYTLNFGGEKVLLDLFEQIVMPSFHETAHLNPRKSGVRVKKWMTAKRDKSKTGDDG